VGGGLEAETDPLAPHRLGIGRLLGETLADLELDAAAWAAAATEVPAASTELASSSAAVIARAQAQAQTVPVVPAKPPARLRLLSGHDTTIVPLLAALGGYDGRWPPYASYLAVELWAEPRAEPGGETLSVLKKEKGTINSGVLDSVQRRFDVSIVVWCALCAHLYRGRVSFLAMNASPWCSLSLSLSFFFCRCVWCTTVRRCSRCGDARRQTTPAECRGLNSHAWCKA